jgi:hypothetical protein
MKALKPLIASVLLLLPALFQCCEPVEGDPNLAGAWNCKETSQIFMKRANLTSTFTVTFVRDAVNTNQYHIKNFYRLGDQVTVTVLKDGYTITIPKQSVDGFLFEGSGSLNDDYTLINMTYTADDGGGQVDHVAAEMSR